MEGTYPSGAGTVVPVELREAIRVVVEPSKAEYDWHDDLTAVAEERVDVVLSAIEAAGYRIVDAGRLARVIAAAEAQQINVAEQRAHGVLLYEPVPRLQLHPGDLEGTS